MFRIFRKIILCSPIPLAIHSAEGCPVAYIMTPSTIYPASIPTTKIAIPPIIERGCISVSLSGFPNKVTESDNRLGEIAVLLSVSGIVEVSLANAGHGEIA